MSLGPDPGSFATVGDLRAEHVVLERGIEVVDCVEFDPGLREQDVGLDLAFLVMDLARRDQRLARALVPAYREAGAIRATTHCFGSSPRSARSSAPTSP
ncbi:MAG: hypothetical protein ACJ780_21720 [Solirubrobacteraceae bacterium]